MPARPFRAVVSLVMMLGSLAAARGEAVSVPSPNGDVVIAFETGAYRVTRRGKVVIGDSPLGVTFQAGGPLKDLEVAEVRRAQRDETYDIVAGKSAKARDHCNEATIVLRERGDESRRTIEIVLRAYDDGAAFRYRIPQQPALTDFAITSEASSFKLPPEATAWVLPVPNHTSHYEFFYQPKKVRALDHGKLIGLPLMLELPDGPAIAITEANLSNYAGMYLTPGGDGMLRASLSPLPGRGEMKVKATAPHVSPWRVIMIADSPAKLIESNLISNLNDPCAIADTSWIKPGQVAFLWWNGYLVGHNGRRGGVDTATFKH
jgi:alpha-glucosidase